MGHHQTPQRNPDASNLKFVDVQRWVTSQFARVSVAQLALDGTP